MTDGQTDTKIRPGIPGSDKNVSQELKFSRDEKKAKRDVLTGKIKPSQVEASPGLQKVYHYSCKIISSRHLDDGDSQHKEGLPRLLLVGNLGNGGYDGNRYDDCA